MDKSTEILNELKMISPTVAAMDKINVFHAPDHYFTDLDQRISRFVFLHTTVPTQQVPEGYFNTLSDRILSRIKKEEDQSAGAEIKLISPALFYLKEENVFTVPEGYFDNLSEQVTRRIHPARIVPLRSRTKWWKYAAAAVVAAAIMVTSLQIFNNRSDSGKERITASAGIPDYIRLSFQYRTPQQLNEGIASLNDDEIVKYLEKNGNILDDETLTRSVDTKELPSADDYLTDENTLNNFLNDIGAEGTSKNTQ